jgi:hypothetical protein
MFQPTLNSVRFARDQHVSMPWSVEDADFANHLRFQAPATSSITAESIPLVYVELSKIV